MKMDYEQEFAALWKAVDDEKEAMYVDSTDEMMEYILRFSDDNGPAVIEWAQGCYVAKDSTVFAKVTLGEPMKAPAAASDDASDDTSAATADTFSVCLAALAMSAAALALRKKH